MLRVSDIQLASEMITGNCILVAFVMVLLYDYALTFGEEVQFIWQEKMNLAKVLFLLNRYIPMAYLVILMNAYTNQAIQKDRRSGLVSCLPWDQFNNWLGLINLIVINILLLFRTWALWGRSRMILISLSILLVVCVLVTSWATLYISLNVIDMPSLSNIRPFSNIVFDSTVMALTLIKAAPAREPNGLTPVITLLFKDGIQYFVMIFSIAVANMITIYFAPAALTTMLFPFYTAMVSTLGSRLILNLRGSILRPAYNDQDNTIQLSTLVFNNHSCNEICDGLM